MVLVATAAVSASFLLSLVIISFETEISPFIVRATIVVLMALFKLRNAVPKSFVEIIDKIFLSASTSNTVEFFGKSLIQILVLVSVEVTATRLFVCADILQKEVVTKTIRRQTLFKILVENLVIEIIVIQIKQGVCQRKILARAKLFTLHFGKIS